MRRDCHRSFNRLRSHFRRAKYFISSFLRLDRLFFFKRSVRFPVVKKAIAFTLIEISIALFLLSLLLTALFHLISEFPKASAFLEKKKEKTLLLQEVQIRLNQTLNKYFGNYPLFYDETQQKLHFTYDNGIDIDPAFGAAVHGSLGVDKNHFLILETISMLDPNKIRKEIILKKVNKLTFSFFCPTEKKWKPLWPKKAKSSPAMLRISLHYKGEEVVIAVIFLQKEPIIVS